jgi:hypothetical protein
MTSSVLFFPPHTPSCCPWRLPSVGWAYFTFSTLLKEWVLLRKAAFSPGSVPPLEAINLQAYDLWLCAPNKLNLSP